MAGFEHPDVLVLGGGGILGEAWMSAVLAGIEETAGFDARGCKGFVGTSAGSIVAAGLSAGIDPRSRLGRLPEQPPVPGEEAVRARNLLGRALQLGLTAGSTAAAPLAAVGLRSSEAGGALMRRAALSRVPAGRRSLAGLGRELEQAGARWDGRLRISAVDLGNGRRVMFGAPNAPASSVGAAVEASCAIPGVFRPIGIGGRRYVDGGAWSPTNMDAAPAERGDGVLCLNPTGSLRPSRATPLGAIGLLSGWIAAVEALALERRGARVRTVSPDAATLSAMGGNLMDARPRSRVVAAGLSQGRRLGGG